MAPCIIQDGGVHLEAYLALAKGTQGAAISDIIVRATEDPQVFCFGELLDVKGVQDLRDTVHNKFLNLLELFAYGTYTDFKASQGEGIDLPDLTPCQLTKLRILTIMSLAARDKQISYATLLQGLDLESNRQLEELLIEAIHAETLDARLDQKYQRLHINGVMGRDVREQDMERLYQSLEGWCSTTKDLLVGIEEQINVARSVKDGRLQRQKALQDQVEVMKQRLRQIDESRENRGDQYHSYEYMEAEARNKRREPKMKGAKLNA
eukprot:Clim_evm59s191 gene=Clim_evmTU59s191